LTDLKKYINVYTNNTESLVRGLLNSITAGIDLMPNADGFGLFSRGWWRRFAVCGWTRPGGWTPEMDLNHGALLTPSPRMNKSSLKTTASKTTSNKNKGYENKKSARVS
jgi:hypothetical protein